MAKKIRTEDVEESRDGPHIKKQSHPNLNHVHRDDTRSDDSSSAERKRVKRELKLAKRLAREQSQRNDSIEANQSLTNDDMERDMGRKARKAEKKRLKKLRQEEFAKKDAKNTDHKETLHEKAGHIVNGTTQSQESASESEPVFDGKSQASSNTSRSSKEQTPSLEHSYIQDPALLALPQSEIDSYLESNMIAIESARSGSQLRPVLQFTHLPSDTYQPLKGIFQNFSQPTPIQSASWPFALSGHDVVGVAETGSGKTLAFGVPCLRHIMLRSSKDTKRKGIRAVIVSPTRELAVQIHEQISTMASAVGIQAACVYGGVPKEAQRASLQNSEIVVATPGRLNDLIDEGYAKLSKATYLVLDEADRMLDKGFEDAIRKIISATAPHDNSAREPRQTLMFTATWPPSVRELASSFMRTPVRINIGDSPTGELRANTRITQTVEVIEPRMKEQRLLQLLKQHQRGKAADDRILVFCLYKKEAARVEGSLRQRGIRVAGIHGDMNQEKRTSSLESFKSGRTPVLVATDVAARGLDIPAVKVVINVTFPLTTEDYVHRIGRTGRAGADGLAITLFTEHDKAQSGALINVLKAAKQPVPEDLMKFGTTVKRKQHDAYGAFYKDVDTSKKATKITFDD